MPTLRKLKLEDGKDSKLPTGYVSNLPLIELADFSIDMRKPIESIQEIEIGWQVYLFSITTGEYHRTSKVREIVSREPGKVVFKTQTSIYEITGE